MSEQYALIPTYDSQIKTLENEFKNRFCSASMVLYPDGNKVGVRVDAPEVMMQFTTGNYLGTDTGGVLFYSSVEDLSDPQKVGAFNIIINSENPTAIRIDFTPASNNLGQRSASFIAIVNSKSDAALRGLTSYGTGTWGALKTATVNARLVKSRVGGTITLGVEPLGKVAGLFLRDRFHLPLNTPGVFSFENISAIASGTRCKLDFSNNRLALYAADSAGNYTALVGVFYPAGKKLGTIIQVTAQGPFMTWHDVVRGVAADPEQHEEAEA